MHARLKRRKPDVKHRARKRKPISLAPQDQVLDPLDLWEPPPERGDGIPSTGTRLTGVMKRQLQEIVQSGHFKFRTEGDLIRTALAWFIREKLGSYIQTGQVASSLREAIELERSSLAELAREKAVRKQYHLIRATVREKLLNHDEAGARGYLARTIGTLRGMSDRVWVRGVMLLVYDDPGLVNLMEPGEGRNDDS